jgi:hypothetical protein
MGVWIGGSYGCAGTAMMVSVLSLARGGFD